jgi:hypothetical protein
VVRPMPAGESFRHYGGPVGWESKLVGTPA